MEGKVSDARTKTAHISLDPKTVMLRGVNLSVCRQAEPPLATICITREAFLARQRSRPLTTAQPPIE